MFYTKNLPNWERALRTVLGLTGIGYAAMHWGESGIAVSAAVIGASMALSGLFGFCPMCAMVGRKLNKDS